MPSLRLSSYEYYINRLQLIGVHRNGLSSSAQNVPQVSLQQVNLSTNLRDVRPTNLWLDLLYPYYC